MIVTLKRHTFRDDPAWVLIKESVPLGTRYAVEGYEKSLTVHNTVTGKTRLIDAFLVRRVDLGMHEQPIGYLPCEVFEDA